MEEAPTPPGNPLRPGSLGYLALGSIALWLLMASDLHWTLSVPVGLVCALVAAFGALDSIGSFDDPVPVTSHYTLTSLRSPLLALLLSGLAWVLALRAAVAGSLPGHVWSAPLLVTATSVSCLLGVARLRASLAASNAGSRWHARGGFWLMLLGVVLYVPWLGSYSLLDPWEPHYGEVAREMLARDDWLSLWWAQDGWFWSKPVLDFWLQGLAFSLFGVAFAPDQMLAAAAAGRLPQPEWAARMPIVLFSLGAVYLLYRFVAAAGGRRLGLLSGLVLLCAPYWSLLGHQSMTDMPYVAPLTAAIACFGLGLLCEPEARVRSFELRAFGRTLRLSGFHLLFTAILLTSLPQLTYLLSRNVTLQLAAPPYGFRWHLDELFAGSGMGNCGLPGNESCRGVQPANGMFQPALGAVIWGAALGYLLYLNRGERRAKRLFYLAAWYFTALSALAKGAPGLVLPLCVAGAVLLARRDWAELARSEVAGLALVFCAVCLPWYVQAYMRHGDPFTDRLLFHDMYKRAFVHVHDTNAGADVSFGYYVWQLGYGLFPWSGIALLGLGAALGRAQDAERRVRDLWLVLLLWLALGFAMFTLSLTKFHHYALPCTPPLACVVALALERALEPALPRGKDALVYLAMQAGAALLLVLGFMRFRPGAVFGGVLETGLPPAASVPEGCALLGLGLVLCVLAVRSWRAPRPAPRPDVVLAVLAPVAALVTLLVARDLASSDGSDVPGSARLLHLITYNYRRAWPASLDFEAVSWGFGMVAAAALLALAAPRFRSHAVSLLGATGVWFCAFTLWIYLPRLAPHYGQRELFLSYYSERKGPSELIVAYQMNWKGENFYSGNHLPAFVSTGAKFKRWLDKLSKAGHRVVYFITEHGRIGTLKRELGEGARVRVLNDRQSNNKFALVRVELD